MKRAVISLVGIVLSSCATNEAMPSRSDRLGPLAFDVPSDWQRADYGNLGVQTSVWTPPQNERKESISIVRIERAAAKVKGAPLDQLVEAAQGMLPGARIAKTERFSTSQGVAGVRTSLTFTPLGKTTPYQREHATFVDGDALVHVFYTAVDPDPTVEPFTLVLDSIRHEEGR